MWLYFCGRINKTFFFLQFLDSQLCNNNNQLTPKSALNQLVDCNHIPCRRLRFDQIIPFEVSHVPLPEIFPKTGTHNSPVASCSVHTYGVQLRPVPVTCSCFKWYAHTHTHMLCSSVYIELKWCFYTVCVCVQGRGVSCPRQPPSCSPMVNICSSDSFLWGSGCGDVEEANLADSDRALPLPSGASSFWPLTSWPPPLHHYLPFSFCECPLNNSHCQRQTAPF